MLRWSSQFGRVLNWQMALYVAQEDYRNPKDIQDGLYLRWIQSVYNSRISAIRQAIGSRHQAESISDASESDLTESDTDEADILGRDVRRELTNGYVVNGVESRVEEFTDSNSGEVAGMSAPYQTTPRRSGIPHTSRISYVLRPGDQKSCRTYSSTNFQICARCFQPRTNSLHYSPWHRWARDVP